MRSARRLWDGQNFRFLSHLRLQRAVQRGIVRQCHVNRPGRRGALRPRYVNDPPSIVWPCTGPLASVRQSSVNQIGSTHDSPTAAQPARP